MWRFFFVLRASIFYHIRHASSEYCVILKFECKLILNFSTLLSDLPEAITAAATFKVRHPEETTTQVYAVVASGSSSTSLSWFRFANDALVRIFLLFITLLIYTMYIPGISPFYFTGIEHFCPSSAKVFSAVSSNCRNSFLSCFFLIWKRERRQFLLQKQNALFILKKIANLLINRWITKRIFTSKSLLPS